MAINRKSRMSGGLGGGRGGKKKKRAGGFAAKMNVSF